MDYVTMETSSATWSNILTQFDSFFRRLPLYLPNPCDMSPVLKVIITILKMPGLAAVKVSTRGDTWWIVSRAVYEV